MICSRHCTGRVVVLFFLAAVTVLLRSLSLENPGPSYADSSRKIRGKSSGKFHTVQPGKVFVTLTQRLKNSPGSFENSQTETGRDYLSRIKSNCSSRICTDFLTGKDHPHFKYCIRKTWNKRVKDYTEPQQSTCVFVNGSRRHPMGLASYPGSGNTWVRGLLQKVTGLCTGAIYCDITLRQRGFPGESIRSGVAFLVKSHQTDPRWQGVKYGPEAPFTYFKHLRDVPVFSGGVFILRNPFHAIVAEYKRQMWEDIPDNHIKTLGEDHFGNNSNWTKFVLQEVPVWRDTVLGWLGPRIRPVLLVQYEDFKLNPKQELQRILRFLQVPYSRAQLEAVVRERFEEYKRPHRGREHRHYTETQMDLVRSIVRETERELKSLELDLSGYLEP